MAQCFSEFLIYEKKKISLENAAYSILLLKKDKMY